MPLSPECGAATTALPEEPALPATSARCGVRRARDDQETQDQDLIIEETPVALVFNGVSHAVMLASPGDVEDFAVGFSLSEGILDDASDIYDLEVRSECAGIVVSLTIASQRFAALKERRRNLAGRTGCGLCGVESLEALALHQGGRVCVSPAPEISGEAIENGLRQLPRWQPLRELTGASHGAAWCDWQGNIQLLREDVGRHNALDKLVGAMARRKVSDRHGFALISSRASYEMVQKTVRAGIPALVAVSAPTALAVRMARASGLTLVGFARPGQRVVYSPLSEPGQPSPSLSHTLV